MPIHQTRMTDFQEVSHSGLSCIVANVARYETLGEEGVMSNEKATVGLIGFSFCKTHGFLGIKTQ